jgi:hypothetical protein
MKITTKIIHSLWAGLWSFFLLWVSVSEFSWKWLLVEPQYAVLMVLALGWLTFAVGLLFDRSWAWYGSFVYTVLSLFVAFYLVWSTFAIMQDEGGSYFWKNQAGSFYCELIGAVLAVAVVSVLLQTRHKFLKKYDQAV